MKQPSLARILHRTAVTALAAALATGAAMAQAVPATGAGIYSCTDAQGRRITSDRPIRECMDREQAQLNSDGSVRRRLQPSMTPEEAAAYEEQQRRKLAEENARKEAIRMDRNLLLRYRDEATHQKAREVAVEPLRHAVANSQARIKELEQQRKRLDTEAEFYTGRDLPRNLKAQFDANQVSQQAQRELLKQQQDELRRQNAVYDEELGRLRRLWAGAAPGTTSQR